MIQKAVSKLSGGDVITCTVELVVSVVDKPEPAENGFSRIRLRIVSAPFPIEDDCEFSLELPANSRASFRGTAESIEREIQSLTAIKQRLEAEPTESDDGVVAVSDGDEADARSLDM